MADPININGGSWSHLPAGALITGVRGTNTVWRINARGGLSKVRE